MLEINSFLFQLLAATIFGISVHAAGNQALVSKKAESQWLEAKLNSQLTGVQYFSESAADSNFHQHYRQQALTG